MNNELNLDELMEVSGGKNLVHEYLLNIARKNDMFTEDHQIDLARVKRILTKEDMAKLSRLALNRPLPEDNSGALA